MIATAPPQIKAFQSSELEAFIRHFGDSHLMLAYHAAFPLGLTPDLLNSLWASFQTDIHGQPLNIPRIAIADLLLSGICEEVGYELYAIEPRIRQELLAKLKDDTAFNQRRIQELASFVSNHVQPELHSNDPDVQDFAQAQSWLSMAYLQPEEAVHELAQALADAYQDESMDLSRLASIVLSLKSPLEKYPEFMTYAQGMAKHATGDYEAAQQEFDKLQESSQYFQASDNGYPVPCIVQKQVVETQTRNRPNCSFTTQVVASLLVGSFSSLGTFWLGQELVPPIKSSSFAPITSPIISDVGGEETSAILIDEFNESLTDTSASEVSEASEQPLSGTSSPDNSNTINSSLNSSSSAVVDTPIIQSEIARPPQVVETTRRDEVTGREARPATPTISSPQEQTEVVAEETETAEVTDRETRPATPTISSPQEQTEVVAEETETEESTSRRNRNPIFVDNPDRT